jgi:nucleoside phosphorylase
MCAQNIGDIILSSRYYENNHDTAHFERLLGSITQLMALFVFIGVMFLPQFIHRIRSSSHTIKNH